MTSFDHYKKDIDALLNRGNELHLSMQAQVRPAEFEKALKEKHGARTKEILSSLPVFEAKYQSWYSESKALVKQLLPDRLADFSRCYEAPKNRKMIDFANYTIDDYLRGLVVTRTVGYEKSTVVDQSAAVSQFRQQVAIIGSVKARLESSLFDIQQLVRADLFDSELDAAKELSKHGFRRASGAVAGVVLEKHLGVVCGSHRVKITKKNPTIADFNEALKKGNVIEIPEWRFIQHLGDLRNLCDHDKEKEPTKKQVTDLIQGVAKTIKTLF